MNTNMKYKLVIFDFDGTIVDSSGGILDSHRYTLSTMGKTIPPETELLRVIGGSLLRIYIETFGFPKENALEAIRIYRKRYAEIGIHKAILYNDFSKMLTELKRAGYKIGVATLKAERFAKIMLTELGIAEYFDQVCGMDDYDQLDKATLIKKCMSLCDCTENDSVLVGDSKNDSVGAEKVGIAFIGVTYGFGFKSEADVNRHPNIGCVDTPMDVLKVLCQ